MGLRRSPKTDHYALQLTMVGFWRADPADSRRAAKALRVNPLSHSLDLRWRPLRVLHTDRLILEQQQ